MSASTGHERRKGQVCCVFFLDLRAVVVLLLLLSRSLARLTALCILSFCLHEDVSLARSVLSDGMGTAHACVRSAIATYALSSDVCACVCLTETRGSRRSTHTHTHTYRQLRSLLFHHRL